jgi:hypothetical protein
MWILPLSAPVRLYMSRSVKQLLLSNDKTVNKRKD